MLQRMFNFEMVGKRGCGELNMMWKRQVEKHIDKIGLKKEDATDRTKWGNSVYKLECGVHQATSVNRDKTRFKTVDVSLFLHPQTPHESILLSKSSSSDPLIITFAF